MPDIDVITTEAAEPATQVDPTLAETIRTYEERVANLERERDLALAKLHDRDQAIRLLLNGGNKKAEADRDTFVKSLRL